MNKGKDEEKIIRMALAAIFVHGKLCSRLPEETLDHMVDTSLELADELIRKTK